MFNKGICILEQDDTVIQGMLAFQPDHNLYVIPCQSIHVAGLKCLYGSYFGFLA